MPGDVLHQHLINSNDVFNELNVPEQWDKIRDWDAFFKDLYFYYTHKGFTHGVCYICGNISILFLIVIFSVLFVHINWAELIHCDNTACNHIIFFLPIKPTLSLTLFLIITGLYICIYVKSRFTDCETLAKIHEIVHHEMRIDEKEFVMKNWNELAEQVSIESRIALDIHTITNMIMRQENFMIMLLSLNLLNDWMVHDILIFVFKRCFIDRLLDGRYRTNKFFLTHNFAQQVRFVGIIFLIISPITSILTAVQLIVESVHGIRSDRASLFEREITQGGRVKFRCFNELLHEFDQRIHAVEPLVCIYCQTFPNPYVCLLKRCITFTTSGCILCILVVSCMNEDVIIHMNIQGYNLMWWLAICSAVLAISHDAKKNVGDKHEAVQQLKPFMKRGKVDDVRRFFKHRVINSFHTLIGCFTTPILLIWFLPPHCKFLAEFLSTSIHRTSEWGDFCAHAIHNDINTYVDQIEDKKNESILVFRKNHPQWKT